MKFKTKLVHAVVLGALGVAGSAQAVNLSEDGRGEVLIYPYYTAQNGNDTILSLVNTTGSGKAVKVRIIEGMNSYEVLDFNLYLSPYDAWSAAITSDGAGGAKLVTGDTSCTAPAIPAGGKSFLTYAILDNGPKTAARTKEGYIEVIEMGAINNAFQLNSAGVTFGDAVKHVAGVPANCNAIRQAWIGGVNGNASTFATSTYDELGRNSGGLIGSAAIINVGQGTDYSYDPVVLSAFSDASAGNHTYPGDLTPSLASTSPEISRVFYNGAVVETDWDAVSPIVSPGIDAISAVLMHESVLNEYTVNPGLNAATDIVLTFPTKRAYVALAATAGNSGTRRPFTQDFVSANGVATGACEAVSMSSYGREEEELVGELDFSPQPPGGSNSLCWETNVVSINGSKVLGSENLSYNLPVPYLDGWLSFTFEAANHEMVDDTPVAGDIEYQGLPVVGFAVQRYVNSNVGGVLSNYGGAYINKYIRNIEGL